MNSSAPKDPNDPVTKKTAGIANNIKRLLIEISPLIDEYTRQVCPQCTDVCCKQKHCVFRERDVIYLDELGVDVPPEDKTKPQEGPCQFIGPSGCAIPRWMRPWKCTWFFCESLLAVMDDIPQEKYRRMMTTLDETVGLYNELHKAALSGS